MEGKIAEGEAEAAVVGDGEAPAPLQPARRVAVARPNARPLMRPSFSLRWCDEKGLMACPRFGWYLALA